MAIPISKDHSVEELIQRSGRFALVVTLSLIGLAAIYYCALYFLAQ